jgi:hypothetical protein
MYINTLDAYDFVLLGKNFIFWIQKMHHQV